MQQIITLYLLFQVLSSSHLQVDLSIISLDPPTFNLSFSEPIQCPSFQLLMNRQAIQYRVLGEGKEKSEYFLFEKLSEIEEFNIEVYEIIFNDPLNIKSREPLNVKDFIKTGNKISNQTEYILKSMDKKDSFFKYQSESTSQNIIAILIVLLAYSACLFNTTGLWLMDFIQIYGVIQLHSTYYTVLDYKMSFYLLFQMHQAHSEDQVVDIVYVCLPLMIMIFSLILGLICRCCLPGLAQNSWKWKLVYNFFTYHFLIAVWRVMIFPLFVNTIHIIFDPDHFAIIKRSDLISYMYYGIIVTIFYLYFLGLIMNPHCNQSQKQWQNNKKSLYFQLFSSLYNKININKWYTRNYVLIIESKKVLIALLISFTISPIPNLLIQTFHLFYLFTVRPYKYEFYSFSSLFMQMVVVLFYVFSSLTNLYFSLNQSTTKTEDIHNIMLTSMVLYCFIVFLFLIVVGYQTYDNVLDIIRLHNNFTNQVRIYKSEIEIRSQRQISSRKASSSKLNRTTQQFDRSIPEKCIQREKNYIKNAGIKVRKSILKNKTSLLQKIGKNL